MPRRWLVSERSVVERLAGDPRLSRRVHPTIHPRVGADAPRPFEPEALESARSDARRAAEAFLERAAPCGVLDVATFAEAATRHLGRSERTRRGADVTRELLAAAVATLADHPDEVALLREDPLLLPRALEEVLRCEPVVDLLPRVARSDLDVGSFRVRRGDWVDLSVRAANAGSPPDRFSVRRAAQPHLSFGASPRPCPGAGLARVTCCEALAALLRRWECWEEISVASHAGPR